MEVYRSALASYSTLKASGKVGRWNSNGYEVVYTAGTRSLACLELAVHTNHLALMDNFKILVLSIPEHSVLKIEAGRLREGWHLTNSKAYEMCREIGDKWIDENKFMVLRVPSAIIKSEYNYLLNVNHPDFKKVKLNYKEPFFFDPRIKR